MPFICLARTDIQDGVLQILDLQPNTSQANDSVDPPGQTKYVNETQNDVVATTGAGPITTNAQYDGLAAYLIDNVVSGGLVQATQTITMNTPLVGDTVTIDATTVGGGAVVFTAAAAEVLATGSFNQAAGDAAAAQSLADCVNFLAFSANTMCYASAAAAVCTITTTAYGVLGHGITLVASDPLTTIPGGATFAGAGIGALSAANALTIAQRLIRKMSVPITSSTAANPAVITATNHGLSIGETVDIVGHSVAALNGRRVVAAAGFGANAFSVGVSNLGGTAGTASGTVSGEFTNRTGSNILTGSVAADSVLTTTAAHGFLVGDSVLIAGHSAAGVNGIQTVATVPSTTTFTITVANVGEISSGGTAIKRDVINTVNVAAALTVADTEILNSAGTASTALHAEIMQILSGRGYRLPSGSAVQGATTKAARLGGFISTIGSGAFAYTKDIKGIRATYAGGSLAASDGEGVISFLQTPQRLHGLSYMVGDAGSSGNALDAAGNPIVRYGYHGGSPNSALAAATSRVITTYNDDGTLY